MSTAWGACGQPQQNEDGSYMVCMLPIGCFSDTQMMWVPWEQANSPGYGGVPGRAGGLQRKQPVPGGGTGGLGKPGGQVWDPKMNQLLPAPASPEHSGPLQEAPGGATTSGGWADASVQPFVPGGQSLVPSSLNPSAKPFMMPSTTSTVTPQDDRTDSSPDRPNAAVTRRHVVGSQMRKAVGAKSTVSALALENAAARMPGQLGAHPHYETRVDTSAAWVREREQLAPGSEGVNWAAAANAAAAAASLDAGATAPSRKPATGPWRSPKDVGPAGVPRQRHAQAKQPAPETSVAKRPRTAPVVPAEEETKEFSVADFPSLGGNDVQQKPVESKPAWGPRRKDDTPAVVPKEQAEESLKEDPVQQQGKQKETARCVQQQQEQEQKQDLQLQEQQRRIEQETQLRIEQQEQLRKIEQQEQQRKIEQQEQQQRKIEQQQEQTKMQQQEIQQDQQQQQQRQQQTGASGKQAEVQPLAAGDFPTLAAKSRNAQKASPRKERALEGTAWSRNAEQARKIDQDEPVQSAVEAEEQLVGELEDEEHAHDAGEKTAEKLVGETVQKEEECGLPEEDSTADSTSKADDEDVAREEAKSPNDEEDEKKESARKVAEEGKLVEQEDEKKESAREIAEEGKIVEQDDEKKESAREVAEEGKIVEQALEQSGEDVAEEDGHLGREDSEEANEVKSDKSEEMLEQVEERAVDEERLDHDEDKKHEKGSAQIVTESKDDTQAATTTGKKEKLGSFFTKKKSAKRGLATTTDKAKKNDKAEVEAEEENREQTTCTPPTSELDENEAEGTTLEESAARCCVVVEELEDEREGWANEMGPSGRIHALLAWRRFCNVPLPENVKQLCARHPSKCSRSRPEPMSRVDSKEDVDDTPLASRGAEDRALFGTRTPGGRDRGDRGDRRGDRPGREALAVVLTPSSNAYRRGAGQNAGRDAELKRLVQSLLNKICPENVQIIAKRIKDEANVESVEELEIVIGLIFKKSLAEPHYCETYADLVYDLKTKMPEFPSSDGGKPVTFKSSLLNVCQNEFEAMPRTFDSAEGDCDDPQERQFNLMQQKKRFLANMKFIGNLFLRQLLTTKVISSIVKELMLCDASNEYPEEPIIECVCELLCSIGFTLEALPAGKGAVTQVCGRMLDLKGRKLKDGKGIYSKRVQFVIQDLLDTRAAGWAMKSFKAAAKTKDKIKEEHLKAQKDAESGKTVSGADYVLVGQRPTYLSDPQSSGVGAKDQPGGGAEWQEIPKSRKR